MFTTTFLIDLVPHTFDEIIKTKMSINTFNEVLVSKYLAVYFFQSQCFFQ